MHNFAFDVNIRTVSETKHLRLLNEGNIDYVMCRGSVVLIIVMEIRRENVERRSEGRKATE